MILEQHEVFFWLAIFAGSLVAWGIGANDVSNAMGTSIGSKAITIRQAIVIAGIFEFLGALIAGSQVTHTIRQNIIHPDIFLHDPNIFIMGMLSALFAAGLWLFIASLIGWPISTTHTIVGAIIGFGLVEGGMEAVKWEFLTSIVSGWLLSPVIGGVIAYFTFISTQYLIFLRRDPIKQARKWIPTYILVTGFIVSIISFSRLDNIGIQVNQQQTMALAAGLSLVLYVIAYIGVNQMNLKTGEKRKDKYAVVEKIFAILMVFTACAMAFAHGSNDVANAIGPVAAIISALDQQNPALSEHTAYVPIWVLLLGGIGIIVGLATYGHKVIATVGSKITQLTPSRGFAATLATAMTVTIASSSGLPISTTHTLVGAIFGVGLAKGIEALNLKVIKAILLSWLITLPIGAALCVLILNVLQFAFGY